MITFLSEPVLPTFFKETTFRLRALLQGRPYVKKKYPGHYAINRSLIAGLKTAGFDDYTYNPATLRHVGDTVVVLSSSTALKQAIRWKRAGTIKKLLAGPGLVTVPSDNPDTYAPEVDRYVTLAPWTKDMYLENAPTLQNRIACWRIGVDAAYWQCPPKPAAAAKNILFYQKRPQTILQNQCKKFLEDRGYTVTVLVYGKYTLDEYKAVLANSACLVHFVEQESQGISLAEAWATDTPTLVWDPGNFHWLGRNYLSQSAPYLTEKTGKKFRDFADFQALFENADPVQNAAYAPRRWVLDNMTDEICAKELLAIIRAVDK